MTREKKEMKTPRFLSDAPFPIDKKKDLAFGHMSIADTLVKIIQSCCPKPFTLGLFGKWGTGKTTIIRALTEKLENIDDAPMIANIDAWKYEGDSLRRQFLITLDKELKLGLNYETELTQTLTKPAERKQPIKFDWGMLRNLATVISLILFILGVLVFIFHNEVVLKKTGELLISSGVFSFIFQYFFQLFKRVSVTVTEHRTDSAEGFERRFRDEILGHRDLKGKDLLIIIDNLDRCTDDKVVEMLTTIKTFFIKDYDFQKRCIFLIACDDEAVKKHIKRTYRGKSGNYDADEFLRKFFNAFIRIPKFIDPELQSYTENLLSETHVPELESSSDVAYVITNSFRDNPRQIKQFINTLLSHFMLAREREEAVPPLIPKETVTKNPAFLAKILVLELRFNRIYKKIMLEHLTFEEAEKGGDDKEYQDFMRATNTIRTEDIQPFLYLKQSEAERKIPGFKELQAGLEDDKANIVQEKMQTIKANPEQVKSLERLLPYLIDHHKSRRAVLKNIVSCSLGGLQKAGLVLKGEYYDRVADLFEAHGELKDDLVRIEPSVVFGELLSQCNHRYRKNVVTRYVELFTRKNASKDVQKTLAPEFSRQLFGEFLEHQEWLTDHIDKIKKALEEYYHTHVELLYLLKDQDDQKRFLSAETIIRFIWTLSDSDVESLNNLTKKIELCVRFRHLASAQTAKALLVKGCELLTNENKKPFREQRGALLVQLYKVMIEYREWVLESSNANELHTFSDIVIQGIGSTSDYAQKKWYMSLCLLLSETDANRKPNLDSQAQNFFASAELESLKYVFNSLSTERQQGVIKQFQPQLSKRVQQAQDVFDYLYNVASREIGNSWIVSLVCSENYERGLEKLKSEKYKVNDKRALVENMLRHVESVAPVNGKDGFYAAINAMECADDSELRRSYAQQIKALLTQVKEPVQQVGFKAYDGALGFLSEPLVREISQSTVDWLKQQQPATAGQPHAVRSVTLRWNNLDPHVKKDFVYFIFDKLIKHGINRDNVKLGFSVLQQINPEYEEYHTYYDDILDKTNDASTDLGVIEEIKVGLLSLKPSSTNKDNKRFWSKVKWVEQ